MVVCEGLLDYLSMDEKAQVARQVHALLARHGGLWVTPDLATREQVAASESDESESSRAAHATIGEKTGRRFSDNAFGSVAERVAFFEELGFSVETRPQIDDSFTLTAPARLELSAEHMARLRQQLEVHWLRPRE